VRKYTERQKAASFPEDYEGEIKRIRGYTKYEKNQHQFTRMPPPGPNTQASTIPVEIIDYPPVFWITI